MYTPKPFEESGLDRLHQLVRDYPLGTWVSSGPAELNVDHVPFILDTSKPPNGALLGHVARANPIWQIPAQQTHHVVIFRGPQSYITPNWYPSKREHGKAVPTWNYTVVAAHGQPKFIEDRDWLIGHLRELSDFNEQSQPSPWSYDDPPEEFIERLLKGVVGVEIPIAKIEGKFKANQTSSEPDKIGVIAGLHQRQGDEETAMAKVIEEHLSGGSLENKAQKDA